jgi:valyl-tRNA synthetase
LILLHPIMPFVTEEIWGLKARPTMLVHAPWPTYTAAELVDASADADLSWTVAMIEGIRSARAQMNIPAGSFIPMVVKDMDAFAIAAWDQNEALVKRFARIESLAHVDDLPKGTAALAVTGGTFGLPLAGVIDVVAEKARLEKTLGKLAKELGGLKGRLNNPKFAASAPPEVLEETKANLALRMDEESKLNEALARLAELG